MPLLSRHRENAMINKLLTVKSVGLAVLMSGAAWAGPKCTAEPKTSWISESDMKRRIQDLGYKFRIFKVTDGNCYEIYGKDSNGKRMEVYFHPVTGKVVKVFRG